MPKANFKVTFSVPEQNLGLVLETLAKSATLLGVEPIKGEEGPRPSAPRKPFASRGYVNGQHNKGILGKDLVLQVLGREARAFSNTEIATAFVGAGFSHNSASPQISQLVAEGKIRNVGNGMYCLPGTTIKLGAAS